MPIRITIRGLERVRDKFARIQKEFPSQVKDWTLKAVLYVHSKMPPYPPKPATSTYRRTGRLGASVTTLMGAAPAALSRVEGAFGKFIGIVGTNLEYAPWVIDEDRQTKTHRAHGWYTVQGVVRKLRGGIRDVFKKGLHDFLRSRF